MTAIVLDNPVDTSRVRPIPQLKGRKILFVIDEMTSITAGGTERQLLQLVELTQAAGLLPEILIFRRTKWLTETVAGCPVHHRNIQRLYRPAGWMEVLRVIRWMRAQRFDIVHSFFSDANLLGPVLGRAAGVRCTLTSRRNLHYSMTPSRLFIQRLANYLTMAIVSNCHAVRKLAESMEHADPRKMHVVYNGIDLRAFTPCSATHAAVRRELGVQPQEILIGCVSAVRPIKGVHHLVGAAKAILSQAPLAKICVVGGGSDLQKLQEITASDIALKDRFLWVGAQEDVKPYLRAFDLGVLPSLSEGFSNSILEYMAMGLPVVATDVGGNREALEGEAGILVPPGDEEALANAILQLVNHSSTRMNMGFRAAERVRRWDLDVALNENASLYASLLTK